MYKQVQFIILNFREIIHDLITRIKRLLFKKCYLIELKLKRDLKFYFKIF